MPKGVARPYEERIQALEARQEEYRQKLRDYKKRVAALEREQAALLEQTGAR